MNLRTLVTRSQRCRLQRWAVGDQGSTSLETLILFPVVLLLIFGGMQFGLYYFARSVALAAAEEGSRAAGAQTGSTTQGQAAAAAFISRAGGSGTLQAAHVAADRSATTATVTVTGHSLSLVPGWVGVSVNQRASVPVERITGPSGEFTNSGGVNRGN